MLNNRQFSLLAIVVAAGIALSMAVSIWLPGLLHQQPSSWSIASGAVCAMFPLTWLVLRNASHGRGFVNNAGAGIDSLMIGSAQTAHYLDTVTKKIRQELESVQEIAGAADQIVTDIEKLAGNAKRAFAAAADVRRESDTGARALETSIAHIGRAHADAQSVAALMDELQNEFSHR